MPTYKSVAISQKALTLLLALIAALLCGCQQQKTSPASITISTVDHVQIHARLYPPQKNTADSNTRPQPAGLILIHAIGSDREQWHQFARRAQTKGFMSIALDLRGHGQSQYQGDTKLDYRTFSTDDWLACRRDIEAAYRALLDNGADQNNIAIIGSDIGANIALRYAAKNPDIQTVILLSPGLDYKGIKTSDAIAEYGNRPCLLMSSTQDVYPANSCQTLKQKALGFCQNSEFSGSAHGTSLIYTSSPALHQMFTWLDRIIGPEAARKAEEHQPPSLNIAPDTNVPHAINPNESKNKARNRA